MAASFTDWESTCLVHHGIKGQKWGVRRYQNENGTLTAAGRKHYGMSEGGSRRMSRKYNREIKKLNKLRDRSDINTQQQKAARYDKRAKTGLKIARVGAAIAGAGAAAEYGGASLRNRLISNALRVSRDSQWNAQQLNGKQYMDDWIFWDNKRRDLKGTELGNWNKIYDTKQQQGYETYKRNDQAIRSAGEAERNSIRNKAGLASKIHKGVMATGSAVAATGAGIAAYNKIQSHLAKKRLTDSGHQKAVEKYKSQYEKMAKQFADSPYSELLKQQRQKQQQQQRQKQKKKAG